jgi:hypothetical protein
MEKKQKFTKVQEQVMERFDRGQRLVFMPTNRLSGDAIYWVHIMENGIASVDEKAMYPQLRLLLWRGHIDRNNKNQVLDPKDITFDECDFYTLHRDGCIGF